MLNWLPIQPKIIASEIDTAGAQASLPHVSPKARALRHRSALFKVQISPKMTLKKFTDVER
jgi:hypothetical protein